MSTYKDLLIKHKERLKVKIIISIDNETMTKSYSIYTNMHCDWGIVDEDLGHLYTNKKSIFNKELQVFRSVLRKKPKLTMTDNDESYTRLIYTFLN